ncbi:MAG: acylneuraminate cytidylyltransferase family protein [Oscillibacter sp.]|nr:acylneuraminate cytidylyltransferase family protein [Oscillibacter sp.]
MIALIPARGGSKGLPGKNIRPLCGKPLIAYTIEAARSAASVDRVIVTTDSPEIAAIAREYGAEVPFLRPAALAGDTSSAVDVYLHAVEYLMAEGGEKIDKFLVLLPTVPLRSAADIDGAVRLLREKNATTVLSVKEAAIPLQWYLELSEQRIVPPAAAVMKNRQDQKEYCIPNGAVYVLDYGYLKEHRSYYSDRTFAYQMPPERSVDIDALFDFELAEFILEKHLDRT